MPLLPFMLHNWAGNATITGRLGSIAAVLQRQITPRLGTVLARVRQQVALPLCRSRSAVAYAGLALVGAIALGGIVRSSTPIAQAALAEVHRASAWGHGLERLWSALDGRLFGGTAAGDILNHCGLTMLPLLVTSIILLNALCTFCSLHASLPSTQRYALPLHLYHWLAPQLIMPKPCRLTRTGHQPTTNVCLLGRVGLGTTRTQSGRINRRPPHSGETGLVNGGLGMHSADLLLRRIGPTISQTTPYTRGAAHYRYGISRTITTNHQHALTAYQPRSPVRCARQDAGYHKPSLASLVHCIRHGFQLLQSHHTRWRYGHPTSSAPASCCCSRTPIQRRLSDVRLAVLKT